MSLFSIIVPVYNAEKTLRRCLDSLYVQTDPHFEVIMIENGSSDASHAICREYAAKDSRFHLHACAVNSGPSGARNIGLEHARGTFTAFVDSDDFVEPDYLASLRCAFEQADVVFFGYRQISLDGKLLGEHLPNIQENAGYHETLAELARQDLFGYTWIKAFRRDAIGQHRFSMELNLLEDEVFACEVLAEQKRIAVLPKAIYNYVTGSAGSLVGRTHPDYCRKADAAYQAWKNLLRDHANKNEILTVQANAHVERCMYYGFERDVDVKEFFGLLAESAFFKDSTLDNAFCTNVRAGNMQKLFRMRIAYRAKVSIVKLLKK